MKKPGKDMWLDVGLGGALLLLALAFRCRGLTFGLPYAEARPDELTILSKAFGYGTGDFNPHFFNYPSLLSYLIFLAYGGYAAVLLLTGAMASVSELVVRFVGDPAPFFLIPRMLSALHGAATVALLCALGCKVAGRRSGIAAAALLTVAALHVRDSHFGVTDVPMTAFVVATMLPVLSIAHEGRMRSYVLAGILAGIASSFKYNAALLAVPILVAHLLSPAATTVPLLRRFFLARIAVAAVAMIGAFFVTSPFVVLDWRTFLRDFLYEARHLGGVGETGSVVGWLRHLRFSLWYGVGPVALVAAVAGVCGLWRSDRRDALVLLVFPVVFYVAIGKGYTVFARYVIPVVPFVCLFAGVAMGDLLGSVFERRAGRRVAVAGLVLMLLVAALPQAMRSVRLGALLSRSDTRELAYNDLTARLASGTELGWIGTLYGCPRLPLSEDVLEEQLAETRSHGGGGRLIEARLASARKAGYGLRLRDLTREQVLNGEQLPEYVLVEYYPITWSQTVTAGVAEALRARGYVPVKTFAGASREQLDADVMRYDVQDTFYVPFVGLRHVANPGPELTLWGKEDRSRPRLAPLVQRRFGQRPISLWMTRLPLGGAFKIAAGAARSRSFRPKADQPMDDKIAAGRHVQDCSWLRDWDATFFPGILPGL